MLAEVDGLDREGLVMALWKATRGARCCRTATGLDALRLSGSCHDQGGRYSETDVDPAAEL